LPRVRRLVSQRDRTRCLKEGHRRRSQSLDFSWVDNTTGHARMGLIVPKFQSTAVARNRLRRRLLELWRRNVMGRQGARDLLIRARRDAYQAAFVELRSEVLQFADAVFGPAGGEA
jgi:ribonuclease P protein component